MAVTGNGGIGRIMWKKNVLNGTVSSRDGTDLGILIGMRLVFRTAYVDPC
jgi:hypothetical protein